MIKQLKLIFLMGLFVTNCFAASNNPEQQLVQQLNPLKNLQAKFVQTIYDGKGVILQTTRGTVSLQRPGKFRWEIVQPNAQLLLADGSHVWFYDKALAQVSMQKQQSTMENSPAILLSGTTEKLAKDFTIASLQTSNPDVKGFKLTPRNQNNFFQAVKLYFKQDQLQKMVLIDNLKQITEVNFSQVQTNLDLNQRLFQFQLPKNVDLVRQ